jgi:hypothetical protein
MTPISYSYTDPELTVTYGEVSKVGRDIEFKHTPKTINDEITLTKFNLNKV